MLISVHLLLIVGLLGGVIFVCGGLFAGLCSFLLVTYSIPDYSIQDLVGGVTLSQPAGGKDPPKKDPTTNKTQLHPQNQHKRHKGHPKSIKFRRSKRLHH